MSRFITCISRASGSAQPVRHWSQVNEAPVFCYFVCQQHNWGLKDEKTDKFVACFPEKADWNGAVNAPIMLKSQKYILTKHLLF